MQQLELSLTQGRWVSGAGSGSPCERPGPTGRVLALTSAHLPASAPPQGWDQQAAAAAGGSGTAAGPKPPGLELKVSFGEAANDTQASFAGLAQALGGVLCAGVATAPQLAVMAAPAVGWFSHQLPAVAASLGGGAASQEERRRQQGRRQVYAYLPHEAVCTENLAAWRRLLPCHAEAGLAAMLQPTRLAAAPYYSLGLQLHVASAPASAGSSSAQPQLHLRHVLTAVLPLPAAQQQQQPGLLEAVFGRSLPPACPAASSSALYVLQPHGLAASGCSLQETPAGVLLACDASQAQLQLPSSLLAGGSLQAAAAAAAQQQAELLPPPLVVQHAVQHGSQAGVLMLGVRVPAAAAAAASGGGALLHVMLLVPWQLLVDASSLQLSLNGQVRQGSCMCSALLPRGRLQLRALPPPSSPGARCPNTSQHTRAEPVGEQPRAGVAHAGRTARPHGSARAAGPAACGQQAGVARAGGAARLPCRICGRV